MSAPGRTLRVVVVDDSAFNRRTIAELLAGIPGVDVIGKAADCALAAIVSSDLVTHAATMGFSTSVSVLIT